MRKFNSLAEIDDIEIQLPFIGLVDDKENGIYKSFIITDGTNDKKTVLTKLNTETLTIETLPNIPIVNDETGDGECEVWYYTKNKFPHNLTYVEGEFNQNSGRGVWKFDSISSLWSSIEVTGIKDYTTQYNDYYTDIDEIRLPLGITEISSLNRNRVNRIVLPDSVKTLGDSCFESCITLKSIYLPNSITSIGNNAFQHCYQLTSINISQTINDSGNRNQSKIKENTFKECYKLNEVILPSNTIEIGNYAFNECRSLTSINLPESLLSLGHYSFLNTRLVELRCPINVTNIGDEAFEQCNKLKYIELPTSIDNISNRMLKGCVSLTSIDIPNNVYTINTSAFSNCCSLTYIDTNQAYEIKDNAFAYCMKLHDAIITAGSLGNNIFKGCFTLKNIIILTDAVPSFDGEEYSLGLEGNVNIYVPDNLITDYQNDSDWSKYSSYILPLSSFENAERYTSRLN